MNNDFQNKGQENYSAPEERQLRKQIALEKAASHKSQTRIIIIAASLVLIVALAFLGITILNNYKKTQYEQAIELLNAGNYSAAYDKLMGIHDYSNVKEILSQNEGIQALIKAREEVLNKFRTKGSIVWGVETLPYMPLPQSGQRRMPDSTWAWLMS